MRTVFNLNGVWELAGFDQDQGDWSRARKPFPIAADVPGEVHPALMAAGVIPDPLVQANCEDVQWVENKEWWYRRSFRLPRGFVRRRVYLEFDGLDTLAMVYLNGRLVGESTNMFIAHRFDVSDIIDPDKENIVEVVLKSVVAALHRMNIEKNYYVRYDRYRIGARKMQASFGWDWNPRVLGAGIWRGARVVTEGDLAITEFHLRPRMERGETWVDVEVDVTNHAGELRDAQLRLEISRGGAEHGVTLPLAVSAGGMRARARVEVPDAERWWPNGLGEQAMYDAKAELSGNGEVYDRREDRCGFRTIELRERSSEGKPAFYFVINGKTVYMKGANWIPADSFPSRVSDEKYAHLLGLARDAHFNLMRVWGGGVYEHDTFYRLCDEYGILLWHDFMYALGDYPGDDGFIGNATLEAETVIRRLRNRPCIGVWCGNSECEMDKPVDEPWSSKRLFHEIIPRAAQDLDGTRPYWPSSPYGGPEAHSGESGTFHGEPWFHVAHEGVEKWQHFIEENKGLFMAEFPTQGVPAIESLRQFISEDALWPPKGKQWDIHAIDNAHRQSKIGLTSLQALDRNIHQLMGDPRNIEEWARMGGLAQGIFLQSQIEYYRRHKFDIGGSMLWMFDDAWPAVDYSIIDYYGRPKPAYFYVKRAYAPVLLCFVQAEDAVEAWVVNDLPSPVSGRLELDLINFEAAQPERQSIEARVEANASARVWSGSLPSDPLREFWTGLLSVDGHIVSRAAHYCALPRNLIEPETKVAVETEHSGTTLTVRFRPEGFVRCVSLDGLPETAIAEDNYFDLHRGVPCEVVVRNLRTPPTEFRVSTGLSGTALDGNRPEAPVNAEGNFEDTCVPKCNLGTS